MLAWRAFKRLAEEVNETNRHLALVIERNGEAFDRNTRALEEMRDEIRANTKAVLLLLDRLGGGEQPA